MLKFNLQVLCLWFIVAISNEKVCEACMSEINWAEINEKLPTGPDEGDERKELFKKFDVIKNGRLALFEVERGLRYEPKLGVFYDAKPAFKRAFALAKDSEESSYRRGDDYVEKPEFRYFLQSLLQSFKCYMAFSCVDASKDSRIELIEFVNAEPEIKRWVGKINDAEEEFKKIDANGGGYILFDEFCNWLDSKDFHIEDDDDNIL
ncbi:flagellar calcium-binding protein-like isoform X1 [Dendronephthya gigantea]|uniref:flagellar calcium-binding protein-like isoform X1 n=1 Tax=Dendronephthya gigantea TaxID=151771 RepID=UPI00106A694C|nr:flagellar calcium-binding protein-like isoform X1 [Dendronephthya gigantea]